ncbi:hypothetical protein A9Q84_17055 [Halobacteriovorax marinus]|uniref:Uncharacterized protein n=1 Tax=Halobacteriovorax marinus TaxID=97084 RepID=A0A1Y5FA06_9BACT|nr:hypothetical protein A9Q84_17055 [Halobacteriovorax marinus]
MNIRILLPALAALSPLVNGLELNGVQGEYVSSIRVQAKVENSSTSISTEDTDQKKLILNYLKIAKENQECAFIEVRSLVELNKEQLIQEKLSEIIQAYEDIALHPVTLAEFKISNLYLKRQYVFDELDAGSGNLESILESGGAHIRSKYSIHIETANQNPKSNYYQRIDQEGYIIPNGKKCYFASNESILVAIGNILKQYKSDLLEGEESNQLFNDELDDSNIKRLNF